MPRRQARLALGFTPGVGPGAGGEIFDHDFQFNFPSAIAAGSFPSEYSEGAGTLSVTNTASIVSASTGNLVISGSSPAAANPRLLAANTRAAGDMLRIKVAAATAGGLRMGWIKADYGIQYGYLYNSGTVYNYVPTFLNLAAGKPTELILILRNEGAWIIDYDESTYTLRFPAATLLDNPSMGIAAHAAATQATAIDYIYMDKAVGKWQNSYCLLTGGDLTPATGASILTTESAWIQFYWIPNTDEVLEIRFRRTDDDNCWLVRCDQAAGTIKLFTRISGSETEYSAGKTQTWTVDTEYNILIRDIGSSIKTFVDNTEKNVQASTTYNAGVTGAKASGFALGNRFVSYPYSLGSEWDDGDAPSSVEILTVGDSKTSLGGWQTRLLEYATAKTGSAWSHNTISGSGWTTSQVQGLIDAQLAATAAIAPDYVLYNLGINDISGDLPDETTWKANVQYIWDAIFTKYPATVMRVMRVWSVTRAVNAVTLNGWMDDLIALNERAYAGPDESVWLENGDNGARMTLDGIHYSLVAGRSKCAQEWLDNLGV